VLKKIDNKITELQIKYKELFNAWLFELIDFTTELPDVLVGRPVQTEQVVTNQFDY
jgi:hypothetical protein